MTKKMMKAAIILAAAALVLAGCATKIPLEVKRTPTLDTTGIQRIAIMPFEAGNSAYQNAANYATGIARARIQEANHFTLVDANEIQRLRRANQSIENHVDALFTGQITHIGQATTSRQGQRTNRQTGVTTTYTTYTREAEVRFNYSLTRARDGSLLGPLEKRGTRSVSSENQSDLTSVETLVNQIIDSQLRYLARDVAPYTMTITRSLEKEPNKELQPQMKAVLEQVKSGSYRTALESYLAIYKEYKSVAAAVNASILYEALGETQTAANFMQEVFTATGNPKARDVLALLNKELQETAGVSEYSDTRRQVERVAGHANEEIQKILPAGAKVWIHNNASSNQSMVNDVIDNLTSAFIRNGITVIDRESIALILSEQKFQMEGNVSDNDFVSIGKLAGANTLVIINITGTGAARRLQVRVLSIERGVPIFQSDTDESWAL